MPEVVDGRKLLTMGQMPNFILLISPIIITFLLFFLGGGPLNIVPGLVWFVSLFIIQGALIVLKKMFTGKLARSDDEVRNAMNAVCGIFSTPFAENIDLKYMPSERVVFHFFTIVYLAIHLFGFAKLPESKIIMPVLFFSFIIVIGIADVVRLKLAKCFSVNDLTISVLVGAIGGTIALATGLLGDNIVFFKNGNPECVVNKKCK
jgi:hypothetical protein